jgi:hypothetical protein
MVAMAWLGLNRHDDALRRGDDARLALLTRQTHSSDIHSRP